MEHKKYVGQTSTITRTSTIKDRVLLSHLGKIDESGTQNSITSVKRLLVNNYDIAANKRKIKGQLPSKHVFGFCKTF